MKRLFGAVLVGTMIFGAVFVSASVLPVTGGNLQAGGVADLTCQADPVSLGYGTMVAGDGKFHIDTVVISNVAGGCNGGKVLLSFQQGHVVGNSGANQIAFLTGTLETGTTTLHFGAPYSGTGPLASAVDEIQVLFKDASSPW